MGKKMSTIKTESNKLGYEVSEDGLTEWVNNGGIIERRALYNNCEWEMVGGNPPKTKAELEKFCNNGNLGYIAPEFGTIVFENTEYYLTTHAEPSSRLLPSNFTNYHEANNDGDLYNFEMIAYALDADGNYYIVSWIFEDEIGPNSRELDTFDYSTPDNVKIL